MCKAEVLMRLGFTMGLANGTASQEQVCLLIYIYLYLYKYISIAKVIIKKIKIVYLEQGGHKHAFLLPLLLFLDYLLYR